MAETRQQLFDRLALEQVWVPQCLRPVNEGETSDLMTRQLYESFTEWAATVGIRKVPPLEKIRGLVKEHYQIDNMRSGLRAYHIAEVPTEIDGDDLIDRYKEEERRKAREYAQRESLMCPYCKRRKYDGNRFDRCYWCFRIVRDGLDDAMHDYLARDTFGERTGNSMVAAYEEMVASGDILPDRDIDRLVVSPTPRSATARLSSTRSATPPTEGQSWFAKGPPCALWLIVLIAVPLFAIVCGTCLYG